MNEHSTATKPGSIPLVEEQLEIRKTELSTGRVRVRTTTETVEETARATLEDVGVEVERVPIGREVETAPSVRTVDDVTIVPIVEEVLIVEKRLVLKEELHIRRSITRKAFEVPVQLRKQRAVVERLSPESAEEN